MRDQQAFLYQCLDTDLEIYLRQQVDENMPIFGDDGCSSHLEDKFLRSYPLFTRRLDYFWFSQGKGQPFAEFYAQLRQKGDEADLAELDVEALYVHRVICAVTDMRLKEKLCKLQNPTLEDVVQTAENYEVDRRNLKELSNEAARLIQMGQQSPVTQQQQSQACINYVTLADMKGKCYGCGGAIHQNKMRECRAMGSTCSKCCRKNHFANVCFGPNYKPLKFKKGKTTKSTGNITPEGYMSCRERLTWQLSRLKKIYSSLLFGNLGLKHKQPLA